MARIRTIKPEFWTSEQVLECSPIARLLFIGLWNFCDDAGNHVDSERTIKAEVFPADDISSSDVRRLLDELSSNGLIRYYTHENKGFLHVTGWRHQKIDRPTYKHPPYSGEDSEPVRRAFDDQSPPEGKGREGKGKIKNSSASSDDDAPPRSKPIPYQAIVDAYNATMTRLPKVRELTPKRKAAIRRVWQASPQRQTLDFAAAYFAECEDDDFLNGTGPYRNGHENWRPSFDYLIREDVVTRVFEQAMDRMERTQ